MPEDDGRRRLQDRSERWMDRQAGNLADRPGRTVTGWFLRATVALVAVILFFGVIGFVGGWFGAAKDVVSPQNVKTQNFNVRQDWNALVTGADNACQASGPTATDSQTFLESPALAYSATYRRTWSVYNREMDNAFEAKAIRRLGLSAYPRHVPDFPEAHGRTPDWCAVSERLATMGPA